MTATIISDFFREGGGEFYLFIIGKTKCAGIQNQMRLFGG